MIRLKFYKDLESDPDQIFYTMIEYQNFIKEIQDQKPDKVEIKIGETRFQTSDMQDFIDYATASQSPCMKRAFQDELVEVYLPPKAD
jgi:hypothetical protein